MKKIKEGNFAVFEIKEKIDGRMLPLNNGNFILKKNGSEDIKLVLLDNGIWTGTVKEDGYSLFNYDKKIEIDAPITNKVFQILIS